MVLYMTCEGNMAEAEKKESEETEAEKGDTDQAPPKKSNLILFILIGVLALSNIAIFLFLTPLGQGLIGLSDGHHEEPKKEEASHKSASKKKHGSVADIDPNTLSYVSVKDLVVNLRSPGAKKGFLKLTMELEVKDPAEKATVEKLRPRIVDQFQVFLRELDFEDLKGAAGLERVRQELLSRANRVVEPIEINNLLFVELVVTR